ncbi:hypothetical protein [Streptococcus dentiloxodontae]
MTIAQIKTQARELLGKISGKIVFLTLPFIVSSFLLAISTLLRTITLYDNKLMTAFRLREEFNLSPVELNPTSHLLLIFTAFFLPYYLLFGINPICFSGNCTR